LLLRSEVETSFQSWARRETTHLGNDAQFMVFVRYRATEDYVEKFVFCCPLAKHTTRYEMFKKIYSFTRNISIRELTACLFVPMVLIRPL